MKRIISIIIAAAMILAASLAFADSYKIGVGQFAQHGSLDNCYQGFLEGLAEAGIVEGENLKVDFQNAQADMGIAQQIAAQFASGRVDMMVGIATPMAQACYNAASGSVPTIFTAVTDPIAAGFVNADTCSATHWMVLPSWEVSSRQASAMRRLRRYLPGGTPYSLWNSLQR